MSATPPRYSARNIQKDITAGLVVFLVALPLCLGIAKASDAPVFAGLVSGIVGGLVVGAISGSHTSVSGPAAGLTAVVSGQLAALGSFQALLLAVTLAGVIQVAIGMLRAGTISAFVPNAVIKGLLAAIGVILILKQIPHLLGHDTDPEGEMSFQQEDEKNTFTEIFSTLSDPDEMVFAAALIGFGCLALLIIWDRIKFLKSSPVPAPLIAVVVGTVASIMLRGLGDEWVIERSHLVNLPVADDLAGFVQQFQQPDFGAINNPKLYWAAILIAAVASLETVLNLEAVDKIDPEQRRSPPNRELVAQGCGNIVAGMIGGLPITSVIVRSSVNLQMGVKTRLSTLFHGFLLISAAGALPWLLNEIPLSCLAAVLLHTGFKLASPKLFAQMWRAGRSQFLPFVVTITAIIWTDLLVGVLIGLGVSAAFILWNNLRASFPRVHEKHLSGEVLRIQLPTQVNFLNRAALVQAFNGAQPGERLIVDASNTDYIDEDVLTTIREYDSVTAPARGVELRLVGFHERYDFEAKEAFVDLSSRDLQEKISPDQVRELLQEGNARFQRGERVARNPRERGRAAEQQFPLAVVLSDIDSNAPTEMLFDVGLGDVFVVRIAGNIAKAKVIGSVEYACALAGAKLVVVLGHAGGAIRTALTLASRGKTAQEDFGLDHFDAIVEPLRATIQEAIEPGQLARLDDEASMQAAVAKVAHRNVELQVDKLRANSHALRELEEKGQIQFAGAIYDARTGAVTFLQPQLASTGSATTA